MTPSKKRKTQKPTIAAPKKETVPPSKKRKSQKPTKAATVVLSTATPANASVKFVHRLFGTSYYTAQQLTLLGLPEEVRKLILDYLLTCDEPLFYEKSKAIDKFYGVRNPTPSPTLWPAILRACKQLRDEGERILYSNELGIRIDTEEGNAKLEGSADAHILKRASWGAEWSASTSFLNSEPFRKATVVVGRFSRINLRIETGHLAKETLRVSILDVVHELCKHSNWKYLTVSLIAAPQSHEGDYIVGSERDPSTAKIPRLYIYGGDHVAIDTDGLVHRSGTTGENRVLWNQYPEPFYASMFILRPLLRLRNRELGACVSVAGGMAEKLRLQMKKAGGEYHLDLMPRDLERHCEVTLRMTGVRDCFNTSSKTKRSKDTARDRTTNTTMLGDRDANEDDVAYFADVKQNNPRKGVEDRLTYGCIPAAEAEDPTRFFAQRQIVLDMTRLIFDCMFLKVYKSDGPARESFQKELKQDMVHDDDMQTTQSAPNRHQCRTCRK
ncbi:uncharacterized protein AB675_10492 [Cyphellophora attinorum]|uniref:Uncharacterized protein n=1 Tax=Cyphellophora attinorum TaxID=1664694 RepID=A0A0N0NIY3_9EURO|nr:uncharacterized protein AB675_10492 [Phialophora attinorum]KPI35979.1 hypothetical protein AB675_10492 [Phialophora attinorum]